MINTFKYLGCFVIIWLLCNLTNNHVQRLGVIAVGFLITVAVFVALAFMFFGNKKKNDSEKEKKTGPFTKLFYIAIWLGVMALVFTKIVDPWLKSIPK